MTIPRSLSSLVCLLLLVSGVALGSAWRVQAMTTEKLEAAKEVQDRTIPEASSAPPSPAMNRKILDNLATAKEVRTAIDGSLRTIGSSVADLRGRLDTSRRIALTTKEQMEALASALASSTGPASVTSRELDRTVMTLTESGALGRAILEELRKLDRKTGTSAP
jgi:hypothetical protein